MNPVAIREKAAVISKKSTPCLEYFSVVFNSRLLSNGKIKIKDMV